MKTTRLYLESSHYWWFCTKCGLPNFLSIQPQGVFNSGGKRLAGPKSFKKGLVVKCGRMHMGLPNCGARRKVFIEKAIFKYMTDKFCKKMNRKHTKSLHKEDKERLANLETEIRKRVKAELIKERKARKKLKKKLKKKRKRK